MTIPNIPEVAQDLKVLFVNTVDFQGGAAIASHRIMEAVSQHGANAQMFVKTKQRKEERIRALDEFKPKGFPAKTLYRYLEKFKNRYNKLKWQRDVKKGNVFVSDLNSVSTHGALNKIEFDVLHLHWINHRFLDLSLLKGVKKPIVWTLHDCWAFTGLCHYSQTCRNFEASCGNCLYLNPGSPHDLSHQIHKIKSGLYKHLDLHIVCPSNWLGREATLSSLLKGTPVHVIPNCIDTSIFNIQSKQEAFDRFNLVDTGRKKILFGAFNALQDERKGFDKLLKSLSYFHATSGDCAELIVFGSEAAAPDAINQFKTTFLGYLRLESDIALACNAADVMVVPSLEENLANTILESLACGTPVVAFAIGGNSDLIKHKQNGYLAEPYSVEDLATGIAWCLEHNKTSNLTRFATEDIAENFSFDVIGKRYKELYSSLI